MWNQKSSQMDNSTSQNKQASLYERLGGEAGIRKIASDILDKNKNNPKIGHHFKEVNMQRLKQLVFEFFSMGTGGPHQYTGRDMITAHKGLNISENDFEIGNTDTIETMEALGIGSTEIKEVIDILNSLKGDVVGK
jgi:truncated hemoglobin YjbI